MNINAHVRLATAAEHAARWNEPLPLIFKPTRGGGRSGTVFCTLEEFALKVGDPHEAAPREDWNRYADCDLIDGAGKVSAQWFFHTPRGLAVVHDYWWNPSNQLSIGTWPAGDRRAFLWLLRWLRAQGFRAIAGTPR